MTLFINDSTISEEVSIDYDENQVATYDDYCDDTYVIKSSDDYIYKTCHNYNYPFTENYSFNVATIYSIRVSYDTPTLIHENKFAYEESNKFSILRIMKRMVYVIVILLNSFMMLLKIIIREEYMLVGIAIISSFLSMC